MQTGKLSEAVLKRSVLRKLHTGISPQCREYYGADCAVCSDGGGSAYTSVCAPPGFEHLPGSLAVSASNNLYAGGAQPTAMMIQAQLPPAYEEADLQKDMEALAEGAKEQGLEILGGHTQVTSAVNEPIYTATGIGRIVPEAGRRLLQPGDTLVLTKWIALGGTAAIARRYEYELRTRYPFALIDKAKEFEKLMSVAPEARAVNHFGQAAVHDLSQGGVFGALWEMAERADVGLEVDLKKIPVRQETVEICEYFDVNPYELYSAGALLIGTEHGESLVRELAQCQIPAVVIGQVTEQTGRVIRNGEDVRYLDRPKQDAWYRLAER